MDYLKDAKRQVRSCRRICDINCRQHTIQRELIRFCREKGLSELYGEGIPSYLYVLGYEREACFVMD